MSVQVVPTREPQELPLYVVHNMHAYDLRVQKAQRRTIWELFKTISETSRLFQMALFKTQIRGVGLQSPNHTKWSVQHLQVKNISSLPCYPRDKQREGGEKKEKKQTNKRE